MKIIKILCFLFFFNNVFNKNEKNFSFENLIYKHKFKIINLLILSYLIDQSLFFYKNHPYEEKNKIIKYIYKDIEFLKENNYLKKNSIEIEFFQNKKGIDNKNTEKKNDNLKNTRLGEKVFAESSYNNTNYLNELVIGFYKFAYRVYLLDNSKDPKKISVLDEFFLDLNENKKLKDKNKPFKENFKITSENNNLITITGSDLNRLFYEYKELKNRKNRESRIAISQLVKLCFQKIYDDENEDNFEKDVLLISAWGVNEGNHIDKMHEEIFEEFYKFTEKNKDKKCALFMPAIGLGIFNGEKELYWNSMIKKLNENKELIQKIKENKVEIYYNPISQKSLKGDWAYFIKYKNDEEKKLINIHENDIYYYANQFKKKTDYEVAILNPSNKGNVNKVENLGLDGGGEGFIFKITTIFLNKIFEAIINNYKN